MKVTILNPKKPKDSNPFQRTIYNNMFHGMTTEINKFPELTETLEENLEKMNQVLKKYKQ